MRREHLHLASAALVLWWSGVGCSPFAKPGVRSGHTKPAPSAAPPTASSPPSTAAPEPPPSTATQAPPPTLLVSDVSVSERHACALASNGDVWCWGANDSKQVATTTVDPQTSPVRVPLPQAASAVVAADYASCAILSDGRRACWGYGRAIAIESAQRFERLVSTWPANCALTPRQELVCGGYNYFGVVGVPITERGEFQKQLPFRPVPLAGSVEQAAVAGDLGCALVGPERKLFCWGNGWGCSGPQPVEMPASVTALHGGGDRVCLLAANGDVYEFSAVNESYRVSEQDPDYYPTPSCHDSDEDVRQWRSKIAEGATEVSCFARRGSKCTACSGCIVDSDQRVRCWDDHADVQGSMVVPKLVEGISHPTRIAAGDGFYCAVMESGLLQCWGQNRQGQLGRGHVSAAEATPAEPAWPLPRPGGESLAPAGE